MGLREALNKNNKVAYALAIGLTMVALILAVWNLAGSGPGESSGQFYYTVDDGANWFADTADRVPPFDHNGKPAVRAKVFRCPDGKAFVGSLEKFTDSGKAALDGIRQRNEMTNSGAIAAVYESELLVKKPGETKWHAQRTPEGNKSESVTCPGNTPVEVIEP